MAGESESRASVRVTRRQDLAEEIINDTFFVVWTSAQRFREESRVSTWIVGIAWLVQMKGWKPAEAYVFCSLACDLRVTQVVDGNKGIHAMVPRALIE